MLPVFVPYRQYGATFADISCFHMQMSATDKLQQHPAVQQAQVKAQYYLGQLDKEVRCLFSILFSRGVARRAREGAAVRPPDGG